MAKRGRGKKERPVFDSIRKPTAPNSQKIGGDRPVERLHPAKRKVKHKNKLLERDGIENDV